MGKRKKVQVAGDADGGFEPIPISPEAMPPAVKALGDELLILSETVERALDPLEDLLWRAEDLKAHVKVAVAEKLEGTPLDRIKTPKPIVAVPTLQGLRLTKDEPDLREMYLNLLAASMGKETAQNAHPAFVDFIRQMTSDEAKILEVIALEEIVSLSLVVRDKNGDDEGSEIPKYAILAEKSKVEHPDLIESYLDNLRRLGLTQQTADGWHKLNFNPNGSIDYYKNDGRSLYTPVNDPMMIDAVRDRFADELRMEEGKSDGLSIQFHILSEHVQLTSLGEQFARACIVPWKTDEPIEGE
jgi:hypothetical protein